MSNRSLTFQVGSDSSPSFSQQGQVDWVAFGNTTWNITSAVLQRCAAAEVQPATVGASLALGSRFKLGRQGQQRVNQALSSLRGNSSFRKLLWFGFGYQSFVHTIATNQPGVNCAALCACLADIHSLEVAAYILQDLWEACEFPTQYQPSHEQFFNLLKACQGVVSRTTFGTTVDRMIGRESLAARGLTARDNQPASYAANDWDRCARSRDTAKVLRALFDISTGRIESITVIGHGECAFIAALAEWLFDLNVRVEGIYNGLREDQPPQVAVRYADRIDNSSHTGVARLESTTYYLENTRNFWEQLSMSEDARSSSLLILRTPWTTCLSRSFGIYFQELCKVSYALADFLGSAARIYAALALGEPNIGDFEDRRQHFIDVLEGCYGSGLTHAALAIFPELRAVPDLQQLMDLAESRQFPDAVLSFQQSIAILQKHCACKSCHTRASRTAARCCLIGIAYTILRITRILGYVNRDDMLTPTIAGIRFIHTHAPTTNGSNSALSKDIIYDILDLHAHSKDQFLITPIHLFSGTSPSIPEARPQAGFDGGPSAISWGGICCYLNALNHLSSSPGQLRIIHVLPGHIQYNDRQYQAICDRKQGMHMEEAPYWKSLNNQYNTIEPTIPREESRSQLRATVEERSGSKSLTFTYTVSLSTKKDGILPPLYLSPAFTTKAILDATGLIPCYGHTDMCSSDSPFACQDTPSNQLIATRESADQLKFESDIACCVSPPSMDDLDRCIAAYLQSSLHTYNFDHAKMYFRREECLPCCTRGVLRDSVEVMRLERLSSTAPGQARGIFRIINTQ